MDYRSLYLYILRKTIWIFENTLFYALQNKNSKNGHFDHFGGSSELKREILNNLMTNLSYNRISFRFTFWAASEPGGGGGNKQTTRDDPIRWLKKLGNTSETSSSVIIGIGKRWHEPRDGPECARTKGRSWKVRQPTEKTLRIPRRGSFRPLPGAAVHELDADGNEWTNNDKEWAGRREKAESRAGVTIERDELVCTLCVAHTLFSSFLLRSLTAAISLLTSRSFVRSVVPSRFWTLFSPLLVRTSSSYTTRGPRFTRCLDLQTS